MKKVLLGSLLAGGLLFAAKNDGATTTRISGNEQIALASQSPRVHTARMRRHQKAQKRVDQVVSDKRTVNAFIPYGK